jgi:LysM repeat protein
MRSDKVKTPWLIGIIVAVHVVVVGGFLLMQGCGTMRTPAPPPEPQATAPELPPPEWPAPPVGLPAPVPPPPPPASELKTYVIEKGDTLSMLSRRFGVSQAEILGLNGIKDPNKIRLGQKLKLPGYVDLSAPRPKKKVAAAKPAAKPAPKAEPLPVPEGNVYEVQKGDSLSAIAVKFGTTTAALREANKITGDLIRAGQKLTIPGSAAAPAPMPFPAELPDAAPAMLRPPPAEEAPASPAVTPDAPPPGLPSSAAPAGGMREHTVVAGEDLKTIAFMFGVDDIGELRRVNGLTESATLTPGQIVRIPMAE